MAFMDVNAIIVVHKPHVLYDVVAWQQGTNTETGGQLVADGMFHTHNAPACNDGCSISILPQTHNKLQKLAGVAG